MAGLAARLASLEARWDARGPKIRAVPALGPGEPASVPAAPGRVKQKLRDGAEQGPDTDGAW